ncbi:MAG TPA: hydroxymethylglutaryl-CoA reductase [Gemmatimonadaceae bacterium]|nr:hydroxymethylglutaryl-CoA reductase [Gemmatimonadaceae bacterium]
MSATLVPSVESLSSPPLPPIAPPATPPIDPELARPPVIADVELPPPLPYRKSQEADQAPDVIEARQQELERRTGVRLAHVPHYSIDPATLRGNIERFTGVAQVPLGFAGPLRVNGEHARGDFLIPLATTEGSLVASYSRGMKVLNLAGGVSCTVQADRMQRAPVFVFDSAREARAFAGWVQEHLAEIRTVAESTSRVARLERVESYLAHRFAFLRLDYTTGDAAGQNMVGKATLAACLWICERTPTLRRFFLDSQFASEKKVSSVNTLRTRGKRVTAEATIPRAVLWDHLRATPEDMRYWYGVGSVSTHLAGAANSGLHAANAIAAIFIATGQDVANIAEASVASLYIDVTPAGDLYASVTIPSLIVATHGGGTGLATQRECLEVLGCAGAGKVNKLAEIVAGVVLAGELSLGAAIGTLEWVTAHERLGRNR